MSFGCFIIDNCGGKRYNKAVSNIREIMCGFLSACADKRIAIGVSGGRDSMCLLHAVVNCGAIKKSQILAVHVNHNLRTTADRDQQFVRDFCAQNGIPFETFSVNVALLASNKGVTREQAARSLRYGVFTELIDSGRADAVMTAHHALDNAESVLMHLFRGAGLDGACGMKSDKILRPFLNVYPNELDVYAADNGIAYVTDETNLIDNADRNFIRLRVIPLIEERYGGAVKSVNAFSDECKSVVDLLDGMIDYNQIYNNRGAVTVSDAALYSPLAARYMRAAVARFSLTDITRERINSACALVNARTGATAELCKGLLAAREYGGVAIFIPRLPCFAQVPIVCGSNFIDGLCVKVERTACDPKSSSRGEVADMSALSGAVLRFKRDGDMFTPFGGKADKLSRYFIEHKIPKRLRGRIPLIARGNKIIAVVGMQVSQDAAVTESTRERARITLLNQNRK